jgi:hypothetical protein
MVWHQKQKLEVPSRSVVIAACGFEDCIGDIRLTQLVNATRFAAYRDEEGSAEGAVK